MKSVITLLIGGILAIPPLLSSAGTQVVMMVEKGKQPTQTEIAIQDGKLRLDSREQSVDESHQMIYDSQSDSMTIIDHQRKTYSVIDAAMMNQIKQQMEMVKKQMEAQLANMPPQQREMMKKMMQGKMPMMAGMGEKVDRKVKATGVEKEVAGYECTVSEVSNNGKKVRELCVTPWSELKNNEDISATFKGMFGFFTRMMQSLSQMAPMAQEFPFAEIEQLGGFPVLINEFDGATVKETSKLMSIKDQDYAAKHFTPPSGYKRQEIVPPNMGRP